MKQDIIIKHLFYTFTITPGIVCASGIDAEVAELIILLYMLIPALLVLLVVTIILKALKINNNKILIMQKSLIIISGLFYLFMFMNGGFYTLYGKILHIIAMTLMATNIFIIFIKSSHPSRTNEKVV